MVSTGQQAGPGRITAYVKGTPSKPELDIGKMIQNQAVQTGLEMLMQQAGKKK
jgi:hypothetical protein